MSVIRRFNKPQGLKDIDVLIEDDAPISLFFNVVEVPEVITQGKSSFLIGGSNLLKPEVEIKFEITNDDTGAVIYTEPVARYLEGTSRRVSIEVYEDVDLFGDATLTVVGELNPNNNIVPPEFRDTYNVRYTRKLYVSSAGVNTQPILFYNQPRIVVNEIVKPYITTTFPTASITKTGGATGTPIPEEIGQTINVENEEEPAKFVKKLKNNLRFKLFGGGGNNAFVRRGRRRARRASPEVDKFTIQNTSGDKFDARFVGGEIKIPSPQVDTTKFTLEPYHEVPAEYKSDVEDVKNENILVPEKPFTIIDTRFDEDDPQRNVIAPLATENLTYTASMDSVPTQSISTVNFRSYADIRLSRLRTFSGDIDRVKVYARNKDAFGDFELVSDQQIESPELLFNVFGAGNQRVGYFLNQEHINQYWVSSSNATITSDSSYLLNAARISGSNEGVNSFVTFEQTGSLPISFTKDTEYNVSFNALGFKGDKNTVGGSERSGRLGIFISGSGFRVNHDYGSDLGYQLEVNNQPAFLNVTEGEQQDFGQVAEIFSPQVDGNGVLKLVVFSGEFYVSDISINPATSTGFSPNFVQIIAPVPPLTQERPDDYEFFAEFYDVNNNVAESVVFASSSTFVGGNSYIAGGDNLLSGSMFIGSAIGGGIEMAGVNSGFIRSIGYTGFTSASNPSLGSPGFLMFSGSVLPDSGDDYKGVGLELVGGANTFFKFRTNPSELDIRTDSFFIGQESIQFISGSDGNIEISSSLFHLDPKNELLVIGADAVINADLTVNNLRTPAQIGGLPSTEQNASASISSQGFAAFRSASIGGFDVDETTIASTDDSLILKSDGQMTGSSTLIGNKSAGQFLQFKGSTLTVQGDITANNIRTPASINGAPSTDANASSSISSTGFATFKSASIGGFTISTTEISSSGLVLRSSGQLTGSAVSMSGTITADAGRIAGWRIEGSKLSGSNATLDADGAALFKSDQGPGSDTTAAFDQLRNEYYIDFTPADQGNTQNFFVKFGPNFSVDSSGTLFASGAKFEGAITASAGLIGGFTTDSSSFHSDNIFISGSPLQGGVDDPKYMFISTSNFNVKEDGSVTGSQVLFDGGKVGGWTINANQLQANNIKINAEVGYIEAGDLTNVSDYQDSSTGFFVNKDGEILLKAGTSANKNYMRFAGGTLDIRTNDFELDANNLELSSTEASMSLGEGKIILQGASTSTIKVADKFLISADGTDEFLAIGDKTSFTHFNQSTSGVIMGMDNTTAKFEVAADANNYLSFDGSGLDIKAGTFDLATSTLIVDSGTNSGKIALGVTPPTSHTSGTGFYVDGTGKFLVGNTGGNFIQFNGTQIILKSPDFFLGDTTNFLSGSNGNISIQTDAFELDATGVEISSTHASMSLGTGNEIVLQANGNSPFISVGQSTKAFEQVGIFQGVSGGATPQFSAVGTGGHIKFNGTNIDISTDTAVISGSSIQLVTPTFLLGSVSQNNFISGSNGNMKINSDNFELDASNLELSSTQASMSLGEGKIVLQGGGTSTITVGASNSIKLSDDGTDRFLVIGSKTSFSHFNQSTAGFIVGTDSGTTKFELVGDSNNYLSFDGSQFDIKLQQGLELDATNIEISSTNASMSLGEGKILLDGANGRVYVGSTSSKRIEIVGTAGQGYIATGKSSATDTTAGFWLANNNTDPEFVVGNSTNFIKFDGGDLDIASEKLEISASTIQISTAEASMSLGHSSTYPLGRLVMEGVGTPTFKMGPDVDIISMTTGSGIYMDGDGNFRFGDDDGHIKFQNGAFSITGSDVNINVDTIDIQTSAFELSSTHASMSLGTNRQWKASGGDANPFLSIGQSGNGVFGNSGLFLGYNSSTSRPRVSFVGSTSHLKFDSDLDIKTGTLELDATNIEISSTNASMSLGEGNLLLDGANSKIEVGSANKVTIQGGGTDNFVVMGSKSSFTQFDQSTTGIIMGMDSTTPKFEIAKNSSNYFSFDGNNFDIRLSQGLELDASNIELSSTHASMSIGNTNPIILQSIGSDRVLRFGDKTDFGQTTTAGFIMGIDNGTPKLDFTVGTQNDNFFRIDSNGVSLQSDNINIDTDRFKITTNAGNERIRFFSGSDSDSGRVTGAGEFVRIGEVSDDSSDLYGLKIYDGTGTGSADTLVKLGQDGNEIAGWTITQDRLSGGQMIIRSDGTIESSGFASDVAGSGFRLTAADGGFLEVENAKIRGTMATAVFEKESVNAVGGQLYVANSTTLTGSSFPTALAGGGRTAGDYPANETTMSVENVTGFVQGEILSLKKVTDSGFSTEYVFVNSASRQNPSSETDFSGQLYVTRGYGSGVSGDSGSLGDTPSSAQSYSGSQVIVSTGRYISGDAPNTIGSGYIRMNANPADPTTPYIDIIERTGSGIYDVSLKARLGDLSGLSSGLLYGETNPGFGLFTENVFLQGGITATTGSITGKLFVDTSSSQKMIFGIGVDGGSNDGIFINANNYWYTNGVFKVGSATYNIQHDSSGNISITPKTFELDATNLEISSTNASMSLGEGNILLDGVNNKIKVGAHSANNVEIVGSNTQGYIRTGKSSVTDTTSGFWLANNNSDPEFSVGSATNFLKYDGGTLSIETQQLELAANTDDLQISSTQKSMSLAGGNVLLDGAQTTGYIRVGSAAQRNNNINISGSNTLAVIKAGFTGSYADGVSAGDNGFILERNLTNTKFHVGSGTEYIRFDGTNIDISAANFSVTASDVDITAGNSISIDTPDFELSSTEKSMSLGYDTNGDVGINIVGGDPSTIFFGSKTSPPLKLVADDQSGVNEYFLATNNKAFGDTTAGVIIGSDAGVQKLELYKDANEFFTYSSGDGFDLRTTKLDITTGAGLTISGVDGSTGTNNKILLGSATTVDAGEGIFMDGGGNFRVGDATSGGTNFLKFTSSGTLTIKSEDIDITSTAFELVANTDDLQISSTHKSMSLASQKIILEGSSTNGSLKIGTIAGVGDTSGSNKGFFAAGSGDFIAKAGANKYIKFQSGDLDVKTDKLQIDASDFEVSSTEASMSLGEGKIKLIGASTSTITVGAASAITISDDGTDRFVTVGKSNFSQFDQSTEGIIFGTDNGDAKFEVAADSNNYLSFNGNTNSLDIAAQTFNLNASTLKVSSNSSGSIALGASPPTTYETGTGFFVDGAGNLLLGSTSGNFIQFGASSGNLTIKSQVFSLFTSTIVIDSSVNNGKISLGSSPNTSVGGTNKGVYMDGTGDFLVRGNASNFLKFDAGGNTLEIKSDTFDLDATTIIMDSSGDGTIKLGSSASSITETANTGVYIDGAGKFRVGQATSGDNFIHFNGSSVIIKSPDFFLGDSTNFISGSSGNMNISSNAFELDATNIEISSTNASMSLGEGKIILQGGSTSTFTMADKFIISSDGTDEFLAIGDKTSFTHFNQSTAGVIMGRDGSTTKFEIVGDSSNYLSFNGSAFDIKSQTFDLNTSTLRVSSSLGGTIAMGSTVPTDLSSDGIFLSGSGDFNLQGNSDNFIRRQGTELTIRAEKFDLDSNTLVMNSFSNSGKLALGNPAPTSVAYTSNAGVYMDGTGDFLVRADDDNFIKVYSNTLQLKTETFDLDAGTLIMDSATSSGVIKLGSSATNITETANTGVYMDGTGKFRVGTATSGDSYLHFGGSNLDIKTSNFNLTGTSGTIGLGTLANATDTDDTSTGFHVDSSGNVLIKAGGADSQYLRAGSSQLIMKSSDFFLGDTTNFVSSSGGNFEISSSNFHLATNGDVTMAGVVRASTGFIGGAGGWTIGSGKLTSNNSLIRLDGGGGDIIVGTSPNLVRLSSTSTAAISAGSLLPTDAPFQVDFGGAMTASAAIISGSGIEIDTPNFSVTTGGDVKAVDMALQGDITFQSGSTSGGKFATIGSNIALYGTNAVGIDLGRAAGASAAQPGAAVLRSENIYESMIIEGTGARFGADSSKYSFKCAQIAMGLEYISSDQGLLRYSRGTEGLELFTYHDSSGTPNAHTVSNGFEYVRIQPEQSGSVTILQDGAGNGFLSVGANYGDAVVTVGTGLGYDFIIDLPTYVDSDLRISNGSLALGVANNATDGRIDASNDIVAFSTSDIRFKENVTPIQDAVSKIKTLRGVEFDWKPLTKKQKKKLHGNEGHDVGVIAQEVEKVLPEVVQTRKSGYKAVKYEKMIPLLIESIKEQQEQIEELKKEVEELKNGSTN